MDDDERKYEEFSRALDMKIIACGEHYWGCLSEPEKTVQVIRFLYLELQNGGIEQFFINPYADRWRETLDALKRIGAARIVIIFEKALAVFPHSTPSTDHLTRCQQYNEAGQDAANLLLRLDDEYYDIRGSDDLIPLAVAYLKRLGNSSPDVSNN